MITAGAIVSLLLVSGYLALLLRSSEIRRLPFEKAAMMVVAWVLIIAVVAFVASRWTV